MGKYDFNTYSDDLKALAVMCRRFCHANVHLDNVETEKALHERTKAAHAFAIKYGMADDQALEMGNTTADACALGLAY